MPDCTTFTYTSARGWSVPELPRLDSPQTLVVVFAASFFGYDPTPLVALRRAFPQAVMIGCSSAGEINGTHLQDDSIVVAVMRFARTRLLRASAPIADAAGSFAAGTALGAALADPELTGVFMLSVGLKVNGSDLVRGLTAALPAGVVITGGLAGDGARFTTTWVLDGDQPRSAAAVAVGFAGPAVRIGHGSKGGWEGFGAERVVTRSDANVLYELDHQPALALYKSWLGERAAGLPATGLLFPLALREHPGAERQLVRTILAVDEFRQSITFAGDIPQGYHAQLMRANFDRLITGAADSGAMCAAGFPAAGPCLALAVSCIGRRLVLGERIEEELKAALKALPPQTRQVGCYSYGEISPFAAGTCDLHNQTMTLTLIYET